MATTEGQPIPDLRPLLAPRAVAVVGASEGSLGGRCLQSLLDFGFAGPVYPVNPRHDRVFGRRCYPSVEALPEPVECAAISVPAPQVLPVLRQCVAADVPAAIVNTSGFAGAAGGERGRQMQEELTAFVVEHGLLLCGPNCQGTIAVRQRAALYFGDVTELVAAPRAGGLAIISHSGSLMSALFRFGCRRGLGFTYLVSSGNEIALTAADYLRFLVSDEATRVVGAVLEQFRDPEAFATAADLALALGKPLIVLKVGRTEASRHAIRSHTGALAEATAAAEAFCRDRGIILVDSLEALCQTAYAFLQAGERAGKRLGVISPSGGAGCLIADAATELGFELPGLDSAMTDAIRAAILPVGTAANPVDLSGPHLPSLRATAQLLAAHPDVETLVFGHSYANGRLLDALPKLAAELAEPTGQGLPLFALFATDADVDEAWARAAPAPGLVLLRGFASGLGAIRALVDYRQARARRAHGAAPRAAPRPRPGPRATRVAGSAEAGALLVRRGIPVAASEVSLDADEAVLAARRLGYPVALKLASPALPHKSDVGAVWLDLRGDDDVRGAFAALESVRRQHLAPETEAHVLVQRMITGGVELIVGTHRDPQFGMVVLCGLGGVYAETLRDVVLGFPPLASEDVLELLRSLQGFSLLAGTRGHRPADLPALARAVEAVSRLALEEEIESLDVNPLIALPAGQGVVAVDWLLVLPDAAACATRG